MKCSSGPPGAAGVAVGLLGAAAATRLLAPYLFGVSPSDPATYIGIAALLTLVSIGASRVPARRAAGSGEGVASGLNGGIVVNDDDAAYQTIRPPFLG